MSTTICFWGERRKSIIRYLSSEMMLVVIQHCIFFLNSSKQLTRGELHKESTFM